MAHSWQDMHSLAQSDSVSSSRNSDDDDDNNNNAVY